MRREITIGETRLDIECNNGTAAFFQEFTNKNIYDVITEPAGKLAELSKLRSLNLADANTLNDPETAAAITSASKVASETIEIAQELAYIMNLQAVNNKTLEGISEIRKKLNKDDFLVWLMQFSPTDFSSKTYMELTGFWRKQSTGSSTPKN